MKDFFWGFLLGLCLFFIPLQKSTHSRIWCQRPFFSAVFWDTKWWYHIYLFILFGKGILVSEICSEIMEAFGMAVAFLFSNFLLSGMIWPLESVFFVLRYISYWFPQTIAVQSMRNIFTRGWGMEKSEVYVGFLTSFGWMTAFLIITLLHFRLRN